MSWQARLHLNKRWKCYSLCLGNFELERRYVNICFLTPAKLRSGDYIFKYSLLRPGTVQMRGLYIQILVSMPQCSQNIQAIQIDILKSIQTNHAQRYPTKHCRITLRVILFLSNELSIQKSEYHNLSTSTPTTAQIFDAHQIWIYPIRRYRLNK